MSKMSPEDPERTLSPNGNTLPGPSGSPTQHGNRDTTFSCAPTPLLRTMIPGYEVCDEIARGGMGVILAARDLSLDREVALKVLLPTAVPDAARFVQEARITARLPHPGIPPIYALGELPDGRPFLAMKLIRGRTLAAILAVRGSRWVPGPVFDPELTAPSAPGLLHVFEQLCQTVGFAHAQGIIHRDLKPSNVMVGAFGEIQVMDWGLAKPVRDPERWERNRNLEHSPIPFSALRTPHPDDVTATGVVLGTPAYMAPEQARGQPVDERTDVFALGGILCAILTGHPPFEGRNAASTLRRAATGDVSRALERLAGCQADAELVGIAMRCLSTDPLGRPPDAGALAVEVAVYRSGVEERLRAAETERAAAAARAEEATRRAEAEAAKAIEQHRRQRGLLVGAGAVLLIAGWVIAGLWSADRCRLRHEADQRVEEALRQAVPPGGCENTLPPQETKR